MERVHENLEYVKEEVGKILSTSPLLIRKYTKHFLQAEGKYIRALTVLSSALKEDDSIEYDAVYFAAAIEILHLASLVHDDVMDDADMRRGIVTLHKKYGRKTAVICGDYLLAAALNLVNKVENRKNYLNADISSTLMQLALGELNQHLNNGNYKLNMKKYFEIIEGKTAALFSVAAYFGAITAQVNEDELSFYETIGQNMGIVFQLMDDCIDFEESRNVAKKPVQSDFEQGVVTLPLIYGFMDDPMAREKAESNILTRKEVNQLVKRAKGVEKTKAAARNYYDEAFSVIDRLQGSDLKKECLHELLKKAMRL